MNVNAKNTDSSGQLVTLILREAARTEALRIHIRRNGGRAVSLPIFNFETIYDCKTVLNFLRAPQHYQRLLFSGPNGVLAMRNLAIRHKLGLPKNMACGAPGQASRKLLFKAGFTNIIAPPGIADFEALISSTDLGNLSGKHVALVQRQDAPGHATEHLRNLHCKVTPLQCYRRVINEQQSWSTLDQSLRDDINSILAFDTPSLKVLLASAGADSDHIRKLPLGVIHHNIEAKALEMRYQNIIVSGHISQLLDSMRKIVVNSV